MRIASLVACSRAKRDDTSISWKLYDSTLFEKSWTAAMYAGEPYVMSAKHGLVRGDERLDSYDKYIGNESTSWRRSWARDVLLALGYRDYDKIVLFGGRKYVDPVKWAIEEFGGEVEVFDPYRVTSGNGQQMRVADRLVNAISTGATTEWAIEYAMEPYTGDEV